MIIVRRTLQIGKTYWTTIQCREFIHLKLNIYNKFDQIKRFWDEIIWIMALIRIRPWVVRSAAIKFFGPQGNRNFSALIVRTSYYLPARNCAPKLIS